MTLEMTSKQRKLCGDSVADALRAGFDVLPAGQEGRIAVGECLKELFHKAWYIVRIFSA